MFAEMRTGSNFLEANLNALGGVSCLGELFNPHFIGKKSCQELFGYDIAARDADPVGFWTKLRAETEGLVGFRYFNDHEPKIFEPLIADRSCAKIVLIRNPLDSYVSWKIAQATGQWKLTHAKNHKSAKAEFDGAEFESYLQRLQAFQLRLQHALQASGQTAFYLNYDDIRDLSALNGLAAFLGLPARLEAVDQSLKRQNPDSVLQKVSNPEEMEATLARLDRFDLSRTPDFEPRRTAAIPSYLAAADAALLYMPIRGGAEAEVKAWLSAIGTGGVIENMVRKELRQWKQAHPHYRCFTLLRHPLLRAHKGFLRLVGGAMPDHRQELIRKHKADLPPVGLPFLDREQHQAGFLAYLRYVKLALSGQMEGKLDPHFASQSALLQGFAQFQSPDLVLREENAERGLAYLCAETGATPPAFSLDPAPAGALAEIWCEEIEQAAKECYARDYENFGFRAWKSA